jgi:ABC-2 type transport system permease protein
MMRKVWTIAHREYGAMVGTKAFLVSIAIMPIMWFGGIVISTRFNKVQDTSDKTIVVVDGTGGILFSDLQKVAEARNALLKPDANAKQSEPKYVLKRNAKDIVSDEDRIRLSEDVRRGQIAGFIELPRNALSVKGGAQANAKFYAQNAMLSPERGWSEFAVNEAVTKRRLEQLHLDVDSVKRATSHISVIPMGLARKTTVGTTSAASGAQGMASMFIPFGMMMLLFMVMFLSAQPLLESVMEEKSGRVGEVLLGSVRPSELMFGKLLGNVAGSLTIVAIYICAGYLAAARYGWTDLIPFGILPWFLVYQILAILFFSSIFMAIGASVNQMKEAQSMLLPIFLIMVIPMFVWLQIVREPNGSIALWMSLIPTSAPLAMVLRLATESAVPWWQIVAGLAILIATTAACVYLAGRIFRIGILWQGKTPQMTELLRWAWRG